MMLTTGKSNTREAWLPGLYFVYLGILIIKTNKGYVNFK